MRRLAFLLVLACAVSSLADERGVVARVIDADTYAVTMEDGETVTVRAIGVNAPEVHGKRAEPTGKRAAEAVRKMLTGKTVRLERDDAADDRDRFCRLLRFVYLEDGRMVQRILIEQGHARTLLRYPCSRLMEFCAVEAEARSRRAGLWKAKGSERTSECSR